MPELQPSPIYEFGPFRLEVAERRLLRAGRPVALRAKVFDTLRVLVENRGRLLTKDELMQAVWPDSVVEENNLNHNISTLRKALGEKATGQAYVETVPRVGYRFVAEVRKVVAALPLPAPMPQPSRAVPSVERQQIRLCTAPDGVRIAYATVGEGPPLVKAANWMNHLEFEWESPLWCHWIEELAARHSFVRYDERGCGLSDWDVKEMTFEHWVDDMETVVDTLGLERFPILGISQGGAVAIAYAARHPERVTHIVLYGAYARGWDFRGKPEAVEARRALETLVKLGWGRRDPSFCSLFTNRFIPDAKPEHEQWFNDLQRISASPENAARVMHLCDGIDVRPLLGQVRVPTIVFHCDGDQVVPFEEGRLLAASIPGAKLVPLSSRNHLLLASEPAWSVFLKELGAFLGWEDGASAVSA